MKTIVVTGGSGGIGSAISKTFAQNGYQVIITYNSQEDKAQKLIDSLPGNGHRAFQAPNTDREKIEAFARKVEEIYGSIHILVNNAGITVPVPHENLDELSDEWIDAIMKTNFRGSFAMVRAMKNLLVKGAMEDQTPSAIINLSSIAGQIGIGSNVAYCASKAALDSMTKSLARALAPQIRVLSVSPGFVEGEYTQSFDPKFIALQKSNTPLGRLAQSEDVADAVWTAAEILTFSTGSIINVDGGRILK